MNHHTPETKARAAAALAEGYNVQEAAELAGCDRTTIWRWSNEDPEFIAMRAANVEALRSQGIEHAKEALDRGAPIAMGTLITAAKAGDIRAATNLLKLHPEFGMRSKVNLTGDEQVQEFILALAQEDAGPG